jgi:HlyD family secretion protein
VAEANVVPLRRAGLSWPAGGIIAEVLVAEGDSVSAGQALARLDSAQQRANVANAEAALAEAEAQYERLKVGATPEEIAEVEAALAQAQAQYRQVSGRVTDADLVAVNAQVTQGAELLKRLQAGPKATDLRAAEASYQQAQANLTSRRDQLSANKTSAQLQLDQATQALVQAQTAYSSARWNWDEVQRTGRDPVNPRVADPANPGKTKGNSLNDVQKQQYADAFTQAEAELQRAEAAVQQALVAYETAQQAEISGIAAAEQQVAAAQAQFEQTREGAEPDQVSGAQAQLAGAQAQRAQLTGAPRQAELEAAQAGVAQAEATLARIQAGTPESELGVARAQIQRAKAELEVARVALAQTELKAPFDGTVAALELKVGEYAEPGVAIAQLADTSAWQIETDDLTELSVVNVKAGDPVIVQFDAIPGLELLGSVTHIKGFGENNQGDIVYTVLVTPQEQPSSSAGKASAIEANDPDAVSWARGPLRDMLSLLM